MHNLFNGRGLIDSDPIYSILFIAHQLPKGLYVDEAKLLGRAEKTIKQQGKNVKSIEVKKAAASNGRSV